MDLTDIAIAVIISAVIYLILIRIDDSRVRAECCEPTSTATRFVIFFCVFIVSVFGIHFGRAIFTSDGSSVTDDSGLPDLTKTVGGMSISEIPEDVAVGLPPF